MARRKRFPVVPVGASALSLRLPAAAAASFILAWLGLVAYGYWGNLVLKPSLLMRFLAFLGQALPWVLPELARRLPWLAALWLLAAAVGSLWVRGFRIRASRL